jgi:hypothetical protein
MTPSSTTLDLKKVAEIGGIVPFPGTVAHKDLPRAHGHHIPVAGKLNYLARLRRNTDVVGRPTMRWEKS